MSSAQQETDLPPLLLTRTDFLEACDTRDFAQIFRLIKKYAGYSNSKIARLLETTPSYISKIINHGSNITAITVIERAADGLHIPGAMLGLAPRIWEATRVVSVEINTNRTGAPICVADAGEDDEVLRRSLVGLSTTGIVAALPKLDLPAVGRLIGPDLPAQLVRRTARLRRLDEFLGGSDTYQIYVAELKATQAILKEASYSGATGLALLSVAAEQAQQAGWAAFDAGIGADATRLYKMSRKLSEQAKNASLASNALTCLAYQQVSVGADGVELADAACRAAGDKTPTTVRALLWERLAWAQAVSGQMNQAQRSLSQAEEALDQGIDQTQPDWSRWVDRSEIQIMSGRCWTTLKRPLRAVPTLEDALSRYDDMYSRDKALYLSFLADAYLDAGEVEHAATIINRASELSIDIASARLRPRILAVLRRLKPHSAVRGVADVLDRVTARYATQPLTVRSNQPR